VGRAVESSRRAAVRALVTATLLVAGCDNSPTPVVPTGPTRTSPSPGTFVVSGVVVDTLQRPLADARVEVLGGALLGSVTMTDMEGRFSFPTPIAATEVTTIQVSREDYKPAIVPVRQSALLRVMLVPSVFADLIGSYTLTLQAAATCSELPVPLRTRVYVASIALPTSNEFRFTTSLAGSKFQFGYSTFFGALSADSAKFFISSWDAFNWWLEDQPIIEQLDPDGHLSVFGTATVRVSAGAPLVAPLDGNWSYCAASAPGGGQNWPLTCRVAPVECRSTEHRLTLTRR